MKQEIDRRPPKGIADYLSLAVSTCGVGYLPLAPGTWGSIVGIVVYLLVVAAEARMAAYYVSAGHSPAQIAASFLALNVVIFLLFCLVGLWGSGRSCELLGDKDPSRAVVDEVIGQLVVFFFVPFGIGWPFILAGFLLFRLFDIWKPYPIDLLQDLPGGLGVCADDFLAGIYAGACLAIIYAAAQMF
jgi:phosphatidylglycerophosphatase A